MSSNGVIPIEQLEATFPAGLIKSRPGAFGGSLSYLEGHTVIGRLNEAFGGQWSFEILSHEVLDDEVLVLGKFRAESADVVKMAFGSSRITRERDSGQATGLGDDLKAAATDALKKAATLLGVGLYLYAGGKGDAPSDGSFEDDLRAPHEATDHGPDGRNGRNTRNGNPRPNGNGHGSPGPGRVTNRQIAAIFAIARERGMSNQQVRALTQERFNRTVDYLSKQEASQMIEHLLAQ